MRLLIIDTEIHTILCVMCFMICHHLHITPNEIKLPSKYMVLFLHFFGDICQNSSDIISEATVAAANTQEKITSAMKLPYSPLASTNWTLKYAQILILQ